MTPSEVVLRVGDAAPEFTLDSVEGRPFSLASTLRDGRAILLVFLRHFG